MMNILVQDLYTNRLPNHGRLERTYSKIKNAQTFGFSCKCKYARSAAHVMAFDCNPLRLQMMPT
jgi:hypothetical protein